MNTTDYISLVNKPDTLKEHHTNDLEKIIDEFPYFQSPRVLRLKNLYNQDSFKYNHALKVTAAYTSDRTVLFDFITSENFTSIQKGLYEQKVAELNNITVVDEEVYPSVSSEKLIENSILASINEASADQNLEIGKPLPFNTNEKHSFQEWLQLSKINPIERRVVDTSKILEKAKKASIIDKFIENNPKIPPIKKENSSIVYEPTIEEKSYLMTETLAKVYLEQKKYTKAIQAYEILILKYPEKSSFFANRISEIKKIEQNNNN